MNCAHYNGKAPYVSELAFGTRSKFNGHAAYWGIIVFVYHTAVLNIANVT